MMDIDAIFAAVRRWLYLGAKVPDVEHMTDQIVESAWAVIDARLCAYGLEIDPDAPLELSSLADLDLAAEG